MAPIGGAMYLYHLQVPVNQNRVGIQADGLIAQLNFVIVWKYIGRIACDVTDRLAVLHVGGVVGQRDCLRIGRERGAGGERGKDRHGGQ